jgi:hypothetical protein
MAELKARKKFSVMKKSAFDKAMSKLKADPLYQEEMQEYTDLYVDYLAEAAMTYTTKPYIALETRLDYSHVAPEGFGTGDCIMIGGDTLRIIDFKYGKGVQKSGEQNPQMLLYALGALKAYRPIYGDAIKRVHMAIFQPRLSNGLSEYETDVDSVSAWGESIKPIADTASKGEGEYAPGEWCRFCRARQTCRARSDVNSAYEDFKDVTSGKYQKPPLLSDIEVGEILKQAEELKTWVKDLEEYALAALLQGKEIPGWKAVEGRSNRTYTEADTVLQTLVNAAYERAILMTSPELLGITAMEKLLGKKEFTERLSSYIIKPPGKPTLAPVTDNRPPYSSAAADFADIAN